MQKEILVELKDLKKNVSAKRASLGHVLKKNKTINKTVKKAASDLTLVNEILTQENVPDQIMKQAVSQNEDVEQQVAEAADDLKLVNVELAKEIVERIVIESELASTKTDLAESRDDLSRAQVITEEAQKIVLHDPLTGLPNRISYEQHLPRYDPGKTVRLGTRRPIY